MVWKCPPLHLPNWNNLWKWKEDMNKPVAWIGKPELQFGFTDTRVTNEKENWDDIPLYTHQYERPHNTVLVPCDKLAEMQAEIEVLKKLVHQRFDDGKRLGILETEDRLRKAQEK